MKANTIILTAVLGGLFITSSKGQDVAAPAAETTDTKTPAAEGNAHGWTSDMAAAKALATKEKKDLLLDFTGSDWCGWCIKLVDEVFSKDAFKAGVKDKFVLVELDFPRKKQLAPEIKAQNDALQEKMKVRGFPTIMLCDSTGKPYAKTGYQAGGPEKYVEHLTELQGVRVKRDAAFAAAEAATTDAEKAKCLVDGLKALDQEIVDNCYADIIDKIGELDKDDATGFVKARKDAIAKQEAAEKAQGLVQAFFGEKIQPLMQAKDFDKALVEVKTFIKENPAVPEEMQVMMLMNIGLAGPMSKGDADGAMAVVDEVTKNYPNSEISKNADKVKASLKSRLDSMPKTELGEEEK